MWGRYTITQDLAGLEKLVRFICKVADFKARYNLAPRQSAPVLIWEGGAATLKSMRWGLIPSWAKDESIGDKLTNARANTISEKSSYRKPFEKQRCLIPAADMACCRVSRLVNNAKHDSVDCLAPG